MVGGRGSLLQAGWKEGQNLSWVKASDSGHHQLCGQGPYTKEGEAKFKQLTILQVWVTLRDGTLAKKRAAESPWKGTNTSPEEYDIVFLWMTEEQKMRWKRLSPPPEKKSH